MAARGRERRAESEVEDDEGETEQTHQLESESEEDEDEDDKDTIAYHPVPDFPTQIIEDILSRLPIKAVFICRCVCKLWLSLISDHDFAKLHLSRSQVSLLVKPINRKCKPRQLQLVDLKIAPFVRPRTARMKITPRINLPREPKVAFKFLNSCNGLLCLYEPKTKDPIYVCNPILGEYITLPKCPPGSKCCLRSCAFGFSPKTNEYKVVRCFRRQVLRHDNSSITYGESELEIYTLGGGSMSWRSLEKSEKNSIENYSYNAFVNGALHWLAYSSRCPDFLCCFDFGTEKFGAVPEPSEFTPYDKGYSDLMHVGVLRDCLSICDFSDEYRAMIWIMKDYGVKESWSKDYVIENMIYETNHMDWYEPVMILGNGKILIVFNGNGLLLYDPESDEYDEDVHIYGIAKDFRGISHIPSLVSLRDVAEGENVKMCRA